VNKSIAACFYNKRTFRKAKSYRFSSLFSLLSSPEKVAGESGDTSEERREKIEENKKKKPPLRLLLFGNGVRKRWSFVFDRWIRTRESF